MIGITNYPEVLDPALKRAGRLGRQIEVPYLSKEEITNMVKFVEKDMKERLASMRETKLRGKQIQRQRQRQRNRMTSNFWSEVLQTTYEAFEKCKRNGVGVFDILKLNNRSKKPWLLN